MAPLITNPADSAAAQGSVQMPLPGRQFQRFLIVFHLVFGFGVAFILYNRWQRDPFAWSSSELGVIGLVLAQMGLYLRFFVFGNATTSQPRWWALYFSLVYVLWFFTWRLEPMFEWILLAYLGQMFGALPPRISIPAGCAVFLCYLPAKMGWERLGQLSPREWIGYASIAVGWTALGLFLHRLVATSAERAGLIAELERARAALERARERDAELAALRERERLARELHDSLGHNLVTLSVQLEAAQRLCSVDPARGASLLDQMKELTRTSMDQLRRSLAGLRTPGLGDRPLLSAMRQLCEETTQRGALSVLGEFDPAAAGLSPAVAEALWRVAQEGLANVERHAQARSARLELSLRTARHPEAVLRVTDDGIGLPPNPEGKPGHFGLRGLRERVEGLGGRFSVSGGNERGTVLQAIIPILA